MKQHWNPYTFIEEAGYSLVETIGNYVKVFTLKASEDYDTNSIMVPVDWPMGILFRSRKGLRGLIPRDLMLISEQPMLNSILIREPENLKVVAKAEARFVTKTTIEVYKVDGEVKDYYLIDLPENLWRSVAEKLLKETLKVKPKLLYALRAEVPNALKILKRSIPPGSFFLALPCEPSGVILGRYKFIKETLRSFARVLCMNLE